MVKSVAENPACGSEVMDMRPVSRGVVRAYSTLKSWLVAAWRENSGLARECAPVNLNRIVYCALIAVPVNLLNILQVWLKTPISTLDATWRLGVIWGNGTMSVLMAAFLIAARRLKRTGRAQSANALMLSLAAVLLSWSIAIAAVDQLVTPSITPYLLACTAVGAMFLIRPRTSGLLFAASFALFYFAIDRSASPDVLLSNRINGMTAAAVGFCLSMAMWRHFSVEMRQRRQIKAQSDELERVNRELQNMAFTDSLTGLPNRRYFDQAVARELAAIARGNQAAGLIEFDLDFFKEINDKYGHAAGDEVLRKIAVLASGAIRKADMLARYGGEEFILLLPGTPLKGAFVTAEKLRRLIESWVFVADGSEVRLTASFGVSELTTGPAINCYRSVDQALYRAKQKGRNCVEVLAPDDPGAQSPAQEAPNSMSA
jgi:diguanylate cyclase (GGDEF)-like protein